MQTTARVTDIALNCSPTAVRSNSNELPSGDRDLPTTNPGSLWLSKRVAVIAIFALLNIFSAYAALGQSGSETARFQLADTYLRAGQFDRAISLLEDLYAANPEYAFFSKLKQAYENTKKYEEAQKLIDGRLQMDENRALLLSEKARLYYLANQLEQAFEAWDASVAVAPNEEGTYRMVYQSLTQVREFDRAIALLDSARVTLGDQTLFRRELGSLYSQISEYSKSMEEYIGLLQEDARHLATIKTNLGRYADQDGVVEQSVKVVEREVGLHPLNVELRELLGWLYVESGLFEPALDTYRAIDRLQNHQGRTLFAFAGQALSAGSFAIAEGAYKEILTRYPNNAIAPEALRGTGDVNVAWAESLRERMGPDGDLSDVEHYSAALRVYVEFLDKYPVSQNVPYVMLGAGRLYQNVFRDYDRASALYDDILKRYVSHPAADEAVFEKGRLDVIVGNLEDARLEFSRIADRLHTGDLAELARYEVALIHFYRGEFDAAEALVGALKENTSNNTANDAIGLRLLLMENTAPDSTEGALDYFARALLLQRQFKLTDALATIDSLQILFPGDELADEASFARAELLEEQHEYMDASTAYLELALQHPTSFLADRSVFAAARIHEQYLNDVERSIELYSQLLLDYPGSLFVARARERIRILRGDNV